MYTLLLQNNTTKCKEGHQFFMKLTWNWKRANNGICAMFSYESEWRVSSRPVSLKLYCYCIQTGVVFLKSRSFCFCLLFLLLLIYFFVSLLSKVSFTLLFVSPNPLILTFCWGFCAYPAYNFLSDFCIHL